MRRVELKTAYHWNCDECGADNFALPVKAELTDEKREEVFREIHQLQEWDTLPPDWQYFELVQIPNVVACSSCRTQFSTIDERIAEESPGGEA